MTARRPADDRRARRKVDRVAAWGRGALAALTALTALGALAGLGVATATALAAPPEGASRRAASNAGAASAAAAASAATPGQGPGQAGLVDLNSATLAQLRALPGLSPQDARAIINNRVYVHKRDLLSKNIIPQDIFNKIESRIVVNPPVRPPAR